MRRAWIRTKIELGGRTWRARPDREMDASLQKAFMAFEVAKRPDSHWPVYKGESFDIWNPDTGVYYAWADPEPVFQWLQRKRMKAPKRSAHREFSVEHRRNRATLPCLKPRIAFRDVTDRTNRRTVIACLLPPNVFATNLAPYFLWPRGNERDQSFLLGVLCSIPLDWYARRLVENHLTFFTINPFPIPRPGRDDARWRRVVALAGRLACPDDRFAGWAEAVGVAHGPLDAGEKDDMICELDAIAAHLYGLTERQLVHIFETFHYGWDYGARLGGALSHFRAWSSR